MSKLTQPLYVREFPLIFDGPSSRRNHCATRTAGLYKTASCFVPTSLYPPARRDCRRLTSNVERAYRSAESSPRRRRTARPNTSQLERGRGRAGPFCAPGDLATRHRDGSAPRQHINCAVEIVACLQRVGEQFAEAANANISSRSGTPKTARGSEGLARGPRTAFYVRGAHRPTVAYRRQGTRDRGTRASRVLRSSTIARGAR